MNATGLIIDVVLGVALTWVIVPASGAGAESSSTAKPAANAFFAMDTGTKDANHATGKAQVEMIKELGYAGIGYGGFVGISDMLHELDATGLRMFAVYINAKVNADGFSYDPGLKEGMKTLKGRDTIIWVTVTSDVYKPSDPAGDAQAVKMLQELGDVATESGLRVALYPHASCWVERVEDCVRLAKKTERKNVGVTFNLCHWLKVTGGKDMKPLMELAMPHLFVVTINGAEPGDDWDHLIQTLDRGSYDVAGFLRTLRELGYTGPIGLQGYGIKGDVHDNLKRSMEAWRKLSS